MTIYFTICCDTSVTPVKVVLFMELNPFLLILYLEYLNQIY